MTIYGTAVLSICLLVGLAMGRVLGDLVGVEANVGGVGFAMVLLILTTDWLRRRNRLKPESEAGILFWSSLYIPIVVAMAATLNVRGAIHGGAVALLAAVVGVAICFSLVPLIARIGGPIPPPPRPPQ
jgi:malonate transporter MadL subunit